VVVVVAVTAAAAAAAADVAAAADIDAKRPKARYILTIFRAVAEATDGIARTIRARGNSLMAQKHRFHNRKNKSMVRPQREVVTRVPRVPFERKPPVQYGKPFILLEDAQKNTFEFASGAWVAYPLSISQCRQDYLVKELPQKVNGNTRYEIRCPVGGEA
jgi:hypothetical protein